MGGRAGGKKRPTLQVMKSEAGFKSYQQVPQLPSLDNLI